MANLSPEVTTTGDTIHQTVSAATTLINLYINRKDHLFCNAINGTKPEFARAHNLLRVLSNGNPQPLIERMPWFNSALIYVHRWTNILIDTPNIIDKMRSEAIKEPELWDSPHILAACQLAESILTGNPAHTITH